MRWRGCRNVVLGSVTRDTLAVPPGRVAGRHAHTCCHGGTSPAHQGPGRSALRLLPGARSDRLLLGGVVPRLGTEDNVLAHDVDP